MLIGWTENSILILWTKLKTDGRQEPLEVKGIKFEIEKLIIK